MELTQINLGQPGSLTRSGKTWTSGIFKLPQPGPVQVTRLGLQGDVIINQQHHGGVDQAVYIYTADDYDWWAAKLGRALDPGTFGENLTIRGLESAACRIGDRLHIGPVTLEITAPRIPCNTLATRMGDAQFVKKFRAAGRPGLYCRVITEGQIQPGMEVTYTQYAGPTVSIAEAFVDFYEKAPNEEALRRFLAAPIDIRSREYKEQQLSKLTQGS